MFFEIKRFIENKDCAYLSSIQTNKGLGDIKELIYELNDLDVSIVGVLPNNSFKGK